MSPRPEPSADNCSLQEEKPADVGKSNRNATFLSTSKQMNQPQYVKCSLPVTLYLICSCHKYSLLAFSLELFVYSWGVELLWRYVCTGAHADVASSVDPSHLLIAMRALCTCRIIYACKSSLGFVSKWYYTHWIMGCKCCLWLPCWPPVPWP